MNIWDLHMQTNLKPYLHTEDLLEEEGVVPRDLLDPRLQLLSTSGSSAATSKDWFITLNESIKIKFEAI